MTFMTTKLRQKHKQITPDILLVCNSICKALDLPEADKSVIDVQTMISHIASWLAIHTRENWQALVPEKFQKLIADDLFLRSEAKLETTEDAVAMLREYIADSLNGKHVPQARRVKAWLEQADGDLSFARRLAEGHVAYWSKRLKIEQISDVKLASSSIYSARYDEDKLYITFVGGSIYLYKDVPKEHFEKLCQAESAGRYFAQYIKLAYTFERIK